MLKKIISISFIFVCTSIAWMVLGGTTHIRTNEKDLVLKEAVGSLWGGMQSQPAPKIFYQIEKEETREKILDGVPVREKVTVNEQHYLIPDSSILSADFDLEHRRKGLLWYATYRVDFKASYKIINTTPEPHEIFFVYRFPGNGGIYDNFTLTADGEKIAELQPKGGTITKKFQMIPGQVKIVTVSYGAQGMDEWWYVFGENVSQVRNFSLTMTTDFDDINFPENGISPVSKEKTSNGWKLVWEYDNLISDIQIGLEMPQKLNPGPFAGRVSLFAPVSLFLFFFLIFIITTMRNINIHPMSYFFLAAGFFSFHLLLSYLVDHVDIHLAMAICSLVSIILVVSYMRLVVGSRFALIETGISQFIYLVLFSYAFFLEGYTGLTITVCCIVTLFVVMQLTGRMDWDKKIKELKNS